MDRESETCVPSLMHCFLSDRNCVVYRPVGSVGKLQGFQERVRNGFEVCQHQTLNRLNYHRGQSDRFVVIKSCWPWILVTEMMVEDLRQAGTWHVSREVLKMLVNTGDSWSAQCTQLLCVGSAS